MIGPLVLIAACVVSVWVVLRTPARSAPSRAVAAIIVISTLIPVGSVRDQTMAMTALVTIVLLSALAVARRDAATPWPPLWGAGLFAAFGVWLALRILGQFSLAATLLQVAMLASAVALAFVVPLLRREDLPAVADTFLWLILAHTAYAAFEQTGGADAIWPLRLEALEHIDDRANVLLPALTGRSQSTFGHPIPFAVFAGIAALVLIHATAQTRRRRYAAGVVVAAIALALSGTRSAVVAVLAGLIAYGLASLRWRRLLAMTAAAGIVGIVALLVDLPTLLALDGRFESSVSYIHRSLVVGSWDALWARGDAAVVFGSGAGASEELFRAGIVRGASNLLYFDNAYVSLFALSGVVALVLFCAVLGRALFGGALAIGGTVFIGVMGFSFDEQQWQIVMILLAFCALIPRAFGTVSRLADPLDGVDGASHRRSGARRAAITAQR